MERIPTFETPESLPPQYIQLKEQLLSGTQSLKQIRDSLIGFDQETPTRDAADDNLKFLLDPEVINYIAEHPETEKEYYGLLCFTEFHVAQRLAINGKEDALEHFKNAATYVRRPEVHKEWKAYVEATLLYLNSEMIPEEMILEAGNGRNAQILRNFNNGLTARGAPSYRDDYSK